ncbi:AMP-binding protein [Nocardioides sp. AE5]|uniref:AMP-binding protein n=1 Tax=Nocardioides sp. AE5 TaxID=2962573 RepID=UPI002881858C|nr:AMP-binding protein [Nocardioides sp. AE5]MDT0202622.1 AMP-binding protein [Nocardioides sp. AE5]
MRGQPVTQGSPGSGTPRPPALASHVAAAQVSLDGLLVDAAKRDPEAQFVTQGSVQLTYRAFDHLVERAATRLRDAGVAPGDRVFLALANHVDHLVLIFAIARCGAVQVAGNPEFTGDLRGHQHDIANPVLALTDTDERAPEGQAWSGWADPARRFVVEVRTDRRTLVDGPWQGVASVMFTSGSSGLPKAVQTTHASYVETGRAVAATMRTGPEDVFYVFLPLFHGNAQVISLMTIVASGASMVLAERFSASRFFVDVEQHGVTAFTHVGSVLPILLRRFPDSRVTTLRSVFGGAPHEEIAEFGERFGCLSQTGWGMTETGFVTVLADPDVPSEMAHGRPREGFELRIVDEGGAVLATGAAGELQVRDTGQDQMMRGYLAGHDATAWTEDRWFLTGDRGRLGHDGSLEFLGRDKNAIRRSGENIAVAQVEAAILAHPDVLEVAVVGIDDPVAGQEVGAVVALKDPHLSLAELAGWLDGQLPKTLRPRLWKLVDEIPKRGPQKVDYPGLRELAGFWDREAARQDPGLEFDDLRELARGFGLVEGPAYDDQSGRVFFSDVLGGGVHSVPLDQDGPVVCEFPHRRGIGGLARHEHGGWLVSGRGLDVKTAAGTRSVVGSSHGVHGFNDLTVDSSGAVYAGSVAENRLEEIAVAKTSPATVAAAGHPAGKVWKVLTSGETRLIATGLALPNGMALSPAEDRLYVSDSLAHQIRVIALDQEQPIELMRIDLGPGEPDGCAMATDGTLWVAMANVQRIFRISPEGHILERYRAPGPLTTSLAFGGPDMETLLIATGDFSTPDGGGLFAATAPVAGVPRPDARVPAREVVRDA